MLIESGSKHSSIWHLCFLLDPYTTGIYLDISLATWRWLNLLIQFYFKQTIIAKSPYIDAITAGVFCQKTAFAMLFGVGKLAMS